MRGDQLLGEPHHLRSVANDQQVELLVDDHILHLGDRAHQRRDLVGVAVAEIKRAHDHLAVFGGLGLRVRIDEQGVFVQHPALQLVGREQQSQHVFDRFCGDRYRDAQVRLHIAVEHVVQARRELQRFEDLQQRRVAEAQRHRLAVSGLELRVDAELLACAIGLLPHQLLEQHGRARVGRVFGQHLLGLRDRGIEIALTGQNEARLQRVPMTLSDRDACLPWQCARVGVVQTQHLRVSLACDIEVACLGGDLGLPQQGVDRRLALSEIGATVLRVLGAQIERLLQLGQAGLDLPFSQLRLAFAKRLIARAAGNTRDHNGGANSACHAAYAKRTS